ncbi:serine-threonine/tyrosine-protein kinase catalytic domain-containing protein [Artemisia annua]|uniref:non-specific serine/threonine protein kinase n=1 Tax=Artemisia annua TaxID=35608 RepID=A0A2U1NL91_ARTAN|nr:serine-threonine/tyrosine-protein kinase catalytic domain-containing protein [Artemisia annua]
MKSLLKKLHMMPNQPSDVVDSKPGSNQISMDRWLNSVTNRPNVKIVQDKDESMESVGGDPEVEEEYQIQLALELSAREDPEAVQIEAVKQISLASCLPPTPPQNMNINTPSQLLSYRYWNYSALSYDDKILDGFYDLYETSTTSSLSSEMPSLLDLQRTPVSDNITWEAVVVNKVADAKLLQLLEQSAKLTTESVGQNVVQKLAIFVSNHMGGPVGDPDKMLLAWTKFSYKLKVTLGSMVLPLGSLKIGMARHRALLFKVLADSVGIRCRMVKGKQYTGSSDVAMNFIKTGDGREYIVDLMADPGTLIPSDTTITQESNANHHESSLSSSPWSRDEDASRATSSRSGLTTSSEECSDSKNLDSTQERSDGVTHVPKPLVPKNKKRGEKLGEISLRPSYQSHARSPSWTEGVSSPAVRKMKVKDVSQYMIDAAKENPQLAQKLHDVLLESGVVAPANLFTEVYDEQEEDSRPTQDKEKTTLAATRSTPDPNIDLPIAAAATATAAAVVATGLPDVLNPTGDEQGGGDNDVAREGDRVSDRSAGNESTKSEVSLDDVSDCEIAWEDITIGERIGLGSYGEVYRGDWHGTEVAVKKFLDQEITVESLEEFKSEALILKFWTNYIYGLKKVGIMKRVRHPNVVLFMGAITRAPHLSIVTEFLPRGSLYRLIHRPNNQLDIRRRMRIALDAARGMNYLHNCTPVIVHRDLKSPNLLVDKNWVVKVCDFGLSRMKHSTFLSSRSTAGTAEWMAPEVLRNEPSDEKCDVYSFGVILWELCTLQQPWGGMNPMQVVGAVGFQHRRLDIPDDVDPAIGDIIRRCWQTDPRLRPTFADIMATLKPLQKPITSSKATRD